MNEDKDNLILSDNPLSEQQRQTLASLLDMIIPASEDGLMPGASELDITSYIRERVPDFEQMIAPALMNLDELSDARSKVGFAALTDADKQLVVTDFSVAQPDFFQQLIVNTIGCYYQQDQVLQALGLEARAPFPKGNEVEPGDLSLLDPVRQRPKLYRDV